MSQTLKSYIPKVLSENKVVLLQGIGTLRINYRPAVIDEHLSVMSAPREEIYFVPSVEQHLDPVLVKIVELVSKVTHAEATAHVQHFMQDLQGELRSSGFMTLPDVGWIKQDHWGSLFFEPATEYIAMNAFFGFSSIEMPEALSIGEQEALADLKETAVEQAASSKYQPGGKRRPWGFVMGMLAVLLTIAGLFYFLAPGDNPPITKDIEEEALEKPVEREETLDQDRAQIDTATPVNTPPANVKEVGPQFLPVMTAQRQNADAVYEAALDYVIIVGAFSKSGNVGRMVERIENSPYQSVVMEGELLTKVGLRFDSLKDDPADVLDWAQRTIDRNAWIYNEY